MRVGVRFGALLAFTDGLDINHVSEHTSIVHHNSTAQKNIVIGRKVRRRNARSRITNASTATTAPPSGLSESCDTGNREQAGTNEQGPHGTPPGNSVPGIVRLIPAQSCQMIVSGKRSGVSNLPFAAL